MAIDSIVERKRLLRRQCRAWPGPAAGAAASAAIAERLSALPEVRQAVAVAGFLSDATEPDLRPWFRQWLSAGRLVWLPRYRAGDGSYEMVPVEDLEKDLSIGKYKLQEPRPELPAAAQTWCDGHLTWLVPGMAFDRAGRRLGRGKGFYDRLLAGARGPVIGVFFGDREVATVPAAEHDRRLDVIVTEAATERVRQEQELV